MLVLRAQEEMNWLNRESKCSHNAQTENPGGFHSNLMFRECNNINDPFKAIETAVEFSKRSYDSLVASHFEH